MSATTLFNTALVLTSTPADSVPFGQNVTFVANVSETGGGTSIPTGTVTFSDVTGGANSPVLLGTASLDSSGNATLVVSSFLSGTHTISASYAGDSVDKPASGLLTLQVTANTSQPVATTTTVSTSASTITAGDSATLTAHVVQTGSSATPTAGELVSFKANSTYLGQAPLDANGNAVLTVNSWVAGTYDVQASYGGDAAFLASSGDVTVIVTPAASQAATTTVITVTPAQVTAGQTATLVATVSQVGTQAAPPEGELVTFTANGASLGQAALDANGTATLAVGGWVAGTYDVKASYGGDPAYLASSGDINLTVAPAASQAVQTTTVVTTTPAQITAAQTVTLIATVTQVGTQTAPPQGEFVTFTANGTYLGVAPLDANGTATLVIGGWIAGSYDIQASYFGDIADLGSTATSPSRSPPAGRARRHR